MEISDVDLAAFLEATGNAALLQNLNSGDKDLEEEDEVPSTPIANPFDMPALLRVKSQNLRSQTDRMNEISVELSKGSSQHVYYRLPTGLVLSNL